VLFGAAWALDDDRDVVMSLLAPALQALEAIDDLVHAVVGGYDADGQLRGVIGDSVGCSGTQRGVAGAETLNRQEADVAGGLACG